MRWLREFNNAHNKIYLRKYESCGVLQEEI